MKEFFLKLIREILTDYKKKVEDAVLSQKMSILFGKLNLPDIKLQKYEKKLDNNLKEYLDKFEKMVIFEKIYDEIVAAEKPQNLLQIIDKFWRDKSIAELVVKFNEGKASIKKIIFKDNTFDENFLDDVIVSDLKTHSKIDVNNYIIFPCPISLEGKEMDYFLLIVSKNSKISEFTLIMWDIFFAKIRLTMMDRLVTKEKKSKSELKILADDKKIAELKSKYNHLLQPRNLPAMPHVAQQLLQLVSKKDAKISDVQKLIVTDQALSARILSVANSALFGLSRKISTISDAVVILGFNSVRSIAVATCTRSWFNLVDKNSVFKADILWQHSIATGIIAKFIAKYLKIKNTEEIYMAGLLHDIGKLIILLSEKDKFNEILTEYIHSDQDSVIIEKKYIGWDHTIIGSAAADYWNFSDELIKMIRNHHNYMDETIRDEQWTNIVAFANILSKNIGFTFRRKENLNFDYFLSYFDISNELVEKIMDKTTEVMNSSLFN